MEMLQLLLSLSVSLSSVIARAELSQKIFLGTHTQHEILLMQKGVMYFNKCKRFKLLYSA